MSDLFESLRAALAGRYAVERELGRGGMATVFLAEDLKHRRAVAIKVLHRELAAAVGTERFLREIEIAARLRHPHILPLYDSGAAGGLLYYVMPYVEGESLRQRLTREKQLPLDEVLRITTEVAGALAYAHSHGIVHRDIKPENILLSGGSAVVADFGIARAVTAAEEGHQLTQTGTILGTPAYVSPEQAAGSGAIDGRSDEYSLACVTCEMLVGEPPFTGSTAQAILARHSLDAVSPPSIVRATISEAFEDALLRALAKLPADRFPTTTLFVEALATPSRVTGARRWSGTRFPEPRRWTWRRSLAWGVGAAAGLAAVWVGVRVLRGGSVRPGSAASGLDPRRIAVLYFDDLSPGRRLRYLADGLTEALIEQLAQVPVLRVISRNGVAPYRSPDVSPASVANALQVGTIVRGTVEPTPTGYRVSVRLIDGASGADLGRRASFEQPAGAVLAIRDSLAPQVAAFLRERVGEEVELRATRSGTANGTAWSLFEQGERERKDGEARLDRDSVAAAFAGFARADSLFALAAAADPEWAEPVVQRGFLAHRRARLTTDRAALARWLGLARGYADQALERSPDYPRAHRGG